MKKKQEKKKSYPKRESRPKTGKEHHEDMVYNLKDWARRTQENLAIDLAGDKVLLAELETTAAWLAAGFALMSSIVDRMKDKVEPG